MESVASAGQPEELELPSSTSPDDLEQVEQEAVEQENAAPQAALLTAGQQLQAARLAAGLTVTDVAQALKFSPRQVEMLEKDAYDALPGTTIVRGFVRSYAKLLRLDATVLLTLLDVRSPLAPADVRPPDNMGEASKEGVGLQLGPMMSVAIVVLLAAALLASWHFIGPRLEQATQSSGLTVTLPTSSSAVISEAAVPNETVTMPTGSASLPVVSDAVTPAAVPVAPASTPELVFVLTHRSWIEVLDADGKILHSAENPAGARVAMSGKAPFDIVVGNATGVSLSYGGRAIDLAPHTRAEVARLKVE